MKGRKGGGKRGREGGKEGREEGWTGKERKGGRKEKRTGMSSAVEGKQGREGRRAGQGSHLIQNTIATLTLTGFPLFPLESRQLPWISRGKRWRRQQERGAGRESGKPTWKWRRRF